MERIMLGLILFFELINEWRKLIKTKNVFGLYALFIVFLLTILIVDLLLKGYQSFASAIFGVGMASLFDRYKKDFNAEQEYQQ
ncbi:hypothetical protein [Bacillus sp. Marseille-Q3570]|uniref:hypothetical protein n=1 Tax=Bacillus sp. Marseille-Q3570 TaxID=2963522 RepID=UPI0021B819AE|nr:hypothetical protein [Bacillus sp. Marseille-Q3570]